MSSVLALIPARGGSKGVPFKNMRPVGGIPLIGHAIRAAQAASCAPRILLSTDSREMADYAGSLGVPTDRLRPEHLSGDLSPTSDVVRHELAMLAAGGEHFEHILLLQPTTPLRVARHIDEAMARYRASGADSLISVCDVGGCHPEYMYRISGETLEKLTRSVPGKRRQTMESLYLRNGAIYISSVEHFERTGLLVSANPAYYLMDRRCSVNIDEPEDLKFAEALISLGD
jgi:CMP-N,N'-diacetyllegionaminic acid synthase